MRILKLLALLLLIPLLFVAVVLGKAHWEIRQITPPLPDEDELAAVLATDDGPIALRYILNASQAGPDGQVASYPAFVLEWADGRRFLVDAGMSAAGAEEFAEFTTSVFGAGPMQFEATVADTLGDTLPRVQGLGFTHLHNDHTGGSAALCQGGANDLALVQTFWQANHFNYSTEPGVVDLAAATCLQRQVLPNPIINSVPGFPGLALISAAGHTPGSTIFAVNAGDKTWLLAGDVSNEQAALLSNTAKPFWYSWLIVPEAGARLEELRLWLAALDAKPQYSVLVSHDLGAIEASGLERIH